MVRLLQNGFFGSERLRYVPGIASNTLGWSGWPKILYSQLVLLEGNCWVCAFASFTFLFARSCHSQLLAYSEGNNSMTVTAPVQTRTGTRERKERALHQEGHTLLGWFMLMQRSARKASSWCQSRRSFEPASPGIAKSQEGASWAYPGASLPLLGLPGPLCRPNWANLLL